MCKYCFESNYAVSSSASELFGSCSMKSGNDAALFDSNHFGHTPIF